MRVGMIGCGGIARVHGAVLKQLPGIRLTACADCIKERAIEFAEEFGIESTGVYTSYEEMLDQQELDVIHICTPHYLHVPMAIDGLESQLHVLMEKPPGISLQEFQQLQKAERASEKKLGICFQNRYNETVKKAESLLQSGIPGAVKGARALVTWNRGEAYYNESGWRGSLKTEGGGALINQAIHTLDLLVKFLGKPLQAECSMANHHLKGVIEVEDTVEAYIQFSKASACFYATTAYAADSDVLLELLCDHGTIRVEGSEVWFTDKEGKRQSMNFAPDAFTGKAYWGNGHMACIRDYYDCLAQNRPVKNSLASAEDTFFLMMALYQSAKDHKVVQL